MLVPLSKITKDSENILRFFYFQILFIMVNILDRTANALQTAIQLFVMILKSSNIVAI